MNRLLLIPAIVLPTVLGVQIVRLALGPGLARRRWMTLALGAGLGLGLASIATFVALLSDGVNRRYPMVESLAALVLIAGVEWLRRRTWREAPQALNDDLTSRAYPDASPPIRSLRTMRWVIGAVLVGLILAGAARFATRSALHPQGLGDGLEIWNLRARFLYLAGHDWRTAFTSELAWSHPDYPLLIPASVMRTWTYLGEADAAGPIAVAGMFLAATVALLAGAVAHLRGWAQGLLAAVLLLAKPGLVSLSAMQYADVPLAFFVLATLALWLVYDRAPRVNLAIPFLAGVMGGLAMWTKNEGMMFVLMMLVARAIVSLRSRDGRRRDGWDPLMATVLGLLPLLALVVVFKQMVPVANDVIGSSGLFDRLLTPARYGLALRLMARESLEFLPPVLVLLVYGALAGFDRKMRASTSVRMGLWTLGLMAGGYFLAYLASPHDLNWHVTNSFDRLLHQFWPGILLVGFAALRTPEQILAADEAAAGGFALAGAPPPAASAG